MRTEDNFNDNSTFPQSLSAGFAAFCRRTSKENLEGRMPMLKKLSMCAALLALGSVPVAAQQQEAVLTRLEVPGATFDLVLGMPKSPPRPFYDLSESPDALVIHLIGGKLVLTFEDALEMIKAAESLGSPVGASHVAGREPKSGVPLAIYMVSKAEKD
jgi:hypothetical protein